MNILIYDILFLSVVLYIILYKLRFSITRINFKYMDNNFLIISGLILGYVITYRINYIKNVDSVNTRLQEGVFFTSNNCYHIHHFMWMGVIIFFILIDREFSNKKYLNFIISFMLGSSLIDLMFDDWIYVKNNCHKDKIMKFYKNKK